MLSLIPLPYRLLALAVLAGLVWLHGYSSNEQAEAVQAAWDRANAVAVQARQARIDAAREAQDRLQAHANEERRKTSEANKLRDARLADALERLRKRPERPSEPGGPVLSQPAGPPAEGGGCTGAGLYRDDAAFLTRRADLAQRIREQRDTCYSQYERAQDEIKRLNASRPKRE